MPSILGYSFIFFFTILSVLYVIQPLFLEEVKYSVDETILSLKREKTILYRSIKELEMEFDIGNIDKVEFEKRRNLLKNEVSIILKKLKKK
ncbi:MAG: hypothetical protein CBD04_003460 [bacterium TMED144]|nr:MAG: hypothetical protein CBD04_003460 [bacterium TMED144]|tara:strand:+ start:256 stop:528 length:273 start_codon:yes stop_codon:yes gene_type:complete